MPWATKNETRAITHGHTRDGGALSVLHREDVNLKVSFPDDVSSRALNFATTKRAVVLIAAC